MRTRTLNLSWQAFHLQKRGNSPQEYEDAIAGEPVTGSFAIADGASESSFAAEWARILVHAYVESAWDTTNLQKWLSPLQERWARAVNGSNLPWYAEAKRQEGAFATLLGLLVKPSRRKRPGYWCAAAVGDSCLFHVRNGTLLRSFPLVRSGDFSSQPPLLGSRPEAAPFDPKRAHGTWKPEDRIYLMTDALAQWFLRQQEEGRKPSEIVEELVAASSDAFVSGIEDLRNAGVLRNDDVTLIRVVLPKERKALS